MRSLPSVTDLLLVTAVAASAISRGSLGTVQSADGGLDTDLSALSDEFSGSALGGQWAILHPELVQVSFEDDGVVLRPTQSGPDATWYMDGEGPLVYTLVEGDFSCSALVDAFDPTDPDQDPAPEYRLGGLTLRDPDAPAGDHDWVHVAVGAGTPGIPLAVEDKNTIDSNSDLVLHPILETRGWVRITRRGSTVELHYRDPLGGPWQLLRSHFRPDLPRRVQVGMNVMSWQAPANVAVRFERILFARP